LDLSILDHAFDGFALITHPPWRLHFANRTLVHLLGKPAAVLQGLPLERVLSSTWKRGELEAQLNCLVDDATREIEATLPIEFEGGASALLVKAFHVTGTDPPLLGLVFRPPASLATELSEPLRHIDPLTALPDRAFLMARLATLLAGERVADREFAVLFLDLDNFKHINDRNGHLVGDRVLRDVAGRLQSCVRDGDHVTRFGGDEFVVLLERVSGMTEIEPVVTRIRAALSEPLSLPEGNFSLSLSIGVAKSAPHLQSPEEVLAEADREMYAAKRSASAAANSLATVRC
jgi:diguanylate cyclase (GGDEF)-like protein